MTVVLTKIKSAFRPRTLRYLTQPSVRIRKKKKKLLKNKISEAKHSALVSPPTPIKIQLAFITVDQHAGNTRGAFMEGSVSLYIRTTVATTATCN